MIVRVCVCSNLTWLKCACVHEVCAISKPRTLFYFYFSVKMVMTGGKVEQSAFQLVKIDLVMMTTMMMMEMPGLLQSSVIFLLSLSLAGVAPGVFLQDPSHLEINLPGPLHLETDHPEITGETGRMKTEIGMTIVKVILWHVLLFTQGAVSMPW